jgi:recombination protein RecT
MNTAANPKTEVIEAPERPIVVLRNQLESMGAQFQAALPAHIPVERFKRVVMTAIQNNPDLVNADRHSLWNATMRAAQDGLLPDGREGAMVIYNTKAKANGKEVWVQAVQWMPMIAGVRKKVRNSGEISTWDAHVVHAKDAFEYELGDDPFIKHKPCMDGDPGPVIAAYSVATLKSGEKSREVMTRGQIEKVRAVSKSKDGPAWRDWYEEMCRKVVARRHSKVLPMSTDLDDLMRRDDDLYDFKGAKSDEPPPPRPQLRDFMAGAAAPQPEPETEQTPTEETQPETQSDSPMPEFSAADAHKIGCQDRRMGKALKASPGEWRDGTPEHNAWIAAREDGWREEDKEITEREKAAKKREADARAGAKT